MGIVFNESDIQLANFSTMDNQFNSSAFLRACSRMEGHSVLLMALAVFFRKASHYRNGAGSRFRYPRSSFELPRNQRPRVNEGEAIASAMTFTNVSVRLGKIAGLLRYSSSIIARPFACRQILIGGNYVSVSVIFWTITDKDTTDVRAGAFDLFKGFNGERDIFCGNPTDKNSRRIPLSDCKQRLP